MMLFSLNAQLGILSAALLTLAVVIVAPTLYPKNTTAKNPEFPTEKLLASIPDGCVVLNQTRVTPSIFNPELPGTADTKVIVHCIE